MMRVERLMENGEKILFGKVTTIQPAALHETKMSLSLKSLIFDFTMKANISLNTQTFWKITN